VKIPRRLEGRTALVTGSAHGIGRAYAERLSAEGANLVIADLDGAAAEQVAKSLSTGGARAIGVAVDISDRAATEALGKAAAAAFGGVDILVNNAAMFSRVPMSRVPFEDIDPAEWDRMMAVNLRGVWLTCRAVVPHMREKKYGKIVNISSSTFWERTPTRVHYVASKAGIIGFTRTLAAELGPAGITVNCIAPGSTLSEEDPDEKTVAFRTMAAASRSLNRLQKPEDLVGAIAFFASPDSDFITGQTLVVDGGSVFY
jgi:3-oxoacyl-[acyl-carrier protein] reductase